MTTKPQSTRDRTSSVVTTTMVLLGVFGVIAVFHQPILALFFPPAADADSEVQERVRFPTLPAR